MHASPAASAPPPPVPFRPPDGRATTSANTAGGRVGCGVRPYDDPNSQHHAARPIRVNRVGVRVPTDPRCARAGSGVGAIPGGRAHVPCALSGGGRPPRRGDPRSARARPRASARRWSPATSNARCDMPEAQVGFHFGTSAPRFDGLPPTPIRPAPPRAVSSPRWAGDHLRQHGRGPCRLRGSPLQDVVATPRGTTDPRQPRWRSRTTSLPASRGDPGGQGARSVRPVRRWCRLVGAIPGARERVLAQARAGGRPQRRTRVAICRTCGSDSTPGHERADFDGLPPTPPRPPPPRTGPSPRTAGATCAWPWTAERPVARARTL